ncbi:MAG: GxxExxY protein [Verrucomicrobia bacterium]|nr:GxxExxY protein [Verrucomicrobiota bacterium]
MRTTGIGERIVVPAEVETLATIAVNAAFEVHRELGPGLLESAYEAAFAWELESQGVRFQRQVPVPVHYKGRRIELGFRADVLMGSRLLVELKAVEGILPVHKAQVITYLKVLNLPLGLLINFNEVLIKDGLRRVLNLRHDATRSPVLLTQ